MKRSLKIITSITFILMIFVIVSGCGKEKAENNKEYTFPVASFIPSGIEYKGEGKIEWSSLNESSSPKYADAYVSNATIESVVSYVQDLKTKGLHNANEYKEEQSGFDEWGSFSWVGTNDAENFSISVTMTNESTKLNLVDASYNLSIVMSDDNPYAN